MITAVALTSNASRARAAERALGAALADAEHEVLTTLGAASIAAGANAAVARATGDVILFLRDDAESLSPDLAGAARRALERCDIVGVAGTTRLVSPGWFHGGPPNLYGQIANANALTGAVMVVLYQQTPEPLTLGMEALDGCVFAVRRAVFERVRFDAAAFPGEHLFDTDFFFSAHLAGLSQGVSMEIHALTPLKTGADPAWEQAAQRFWSKHGKRLPKEKPRKFQLTSVMCASREEARELMATAGRAPDGGGSGGGGGGRPRPSLGGEPASSA